MLWKIVKRIKKKNVEEVAGFIMRVNKIETIVQNLTAYIDTFSEALQNINIGITTLSSLNLKSLEKYKGYLKYFIFIQLFLDILNALGKGFLNSTTLLGPVEPVNTTQLRNFTHKYKVQSWNPREFNLNCFAEPVLFLEYLISRNTLLEVCLLSEESANCYDSFIEAVKQKLVFKDYLFAIKIEKIICVLQWCNSQSKLLFYTSDILCFEAIPQFLLSQYTGYIKTFCNQMLIVKGLFWEEGEYFRTIKQKLQHPEFFRDETKEKLKSLLSSAIQKKEKCGILLYGLPGVGKSSAAIAAFCEMNVLVVRIDHKPTEGLITFLERIQEVPKIILFEEIDMETGEEKSDRIQAILQFLDTSCYDVAVMTANTVRLNPALLRSGRCDLKILLQPPTKEERETILLSLNKKYRCCENMCVSELVELTEGLTHADLHTVCKLAMLQGRHLVDYLPEFILQKEELKKYINEIYV